MSGAATQPSSGAIASSSQSYVERLIDITISLGKGNFGQSGYNTTKLSNLRMTVDVVSLGYPGQNNCNIHIFGMTHSQMNDLSTLGVLFPSARENLVKVEAGNKVDGMAAVYQGYIMRAWQSLDAQPETFFTIECQGNYFDALRPVPAISVNGGADVATIMSGIASQMGMNFENNGVTTKIQNLYLDGSLFDQAKKLARAAGIEMEPGPPTLAIWPRFGYRKKMIPLIAPRTGLQNYPKYTFQGIALRTLYNHDIFFGALIKVESDLKPANGEWYVNALTHSLSAQYPGGPWFTDVSCTRLPGTPYVAPS